MKHVSDPAAEIAGETEVLASVQLDPLLRYGAAHVNEHALLMHAAVPFVGAEVQLWQLGPHCDTDSATHWLPHAA